MNEPTHSPAVVTADELANLYDDDFALRRQYKLLIARLDDPGLDWMTRSASCGIVGVSGAVFFAVTRFDTVAFQIGAAIAGVLTVAAAAPARRWTLQRQRQQLAAQISDIAGDVDRLALALTNPDSDPVWRREQLTQLLRETARWRTGPHFNIREAGSNHRQTLLDVVAQNVNIPNTSWGDITSSIARVGADDLMLFADWEPLGTHLEHAVARNYAADAVNRRIEATNTLRALLDEHDPGVIATANQLAADDPDNDHHWRDLLDTAAALTPR
jgi:outer membrane murein-binding lipoprotein Lpp